MPDVSSKYRNLIGISCTRKEISIPLSKITIDVGSNKTRDDACDDKHVNDLVAHIDAYGIDESLPRPIVEKVGKNHWQMRDGHHRGEACYTLGYKYMVVDEYVFADEKALSAFQEVANIHPPHKQASQDSLVNTLGREITDGYITNTQAEIEARVKELAKGKGTKWRENVIARAIKNNGTHEAWIKYNDRRATDFLNPLGYTTGFQFNPKTGRYGAVCTQGSEWRIACRAISAYNSSSHNGPGIQTDVFIKVEKKGDADVMQKRQSVIDEMNRILDDILDATCGSWKHGHSPIRFVGALPQDAGSIWGESMDDGILECDPDDPKFI